MITSSWVKHILEALQADRHDVVESVVYKIDKLLRRAKNSIDDDKLYDDIKREIDG